MLRGQVREIDLMLPDPSNPGELVGMRKFAVLLRNAPDDRPTAYVPFVLASTWRRPGQPQAYEVLIRAHRGFFPNDTVIDCRWPFTMEARDFQPAQFRLPSDIMREVDLALIVGLQIDLQ